MTHIEILQQTVSGRDKDIIILKAQLAEAQQAREHETAAFNEQQKTLKLVFAERDTLRGLLHFAHGVLLAFIENGSSSPIDPQTSAAKVIVERITAALKEEEG